MECGGAGFGEACGGVLAQAGGEGLIVFEFSADAFSEEAWVMLAFVTAV